MAASQGKSTCIPVKELGFVLPPNRAEIGGKRPRAGGNPGSNRKNPNSACPMRFPGRLRESGVVLGSVVSGHNSIVGTGGDACTAAVAAARVDEGGLARVELHQGFAAAHLAGQALAAGLTSIVYHVRNCCDLGSCCAEDRHPFFPLPSCICIPPWGMKSIAQMATAVKIAVCFVGGDPVVPIRRSFLQRVTPQGRHLRRRGPPAPGRVARGSTRAR